MSSLPSGPSSLVEKLAHQLSTSVSAQTIYGMPIERAGITVIPVAQARYGFGGGGGMVENQPGEARQAGGGSGGGGGVSLTPVGYIEIRAGRARFRRIRSSVVPLVAVSGLLALLLLRSIPKLLPGRKHQQGSNSSS